MDEGFPALALQAETVAELRELYRAAEARAARLRLMSVSGRQLALAEVATADPILAECAARLAYFLGHRSGRVSDDPSVSGLPIPAPGSGGQRIGTVVIDGLDTLEAITDPEDREACRLHLEMMGATIDRVNRERELSDLFGALREREHRLEQVVGQLLTVQEEERRRVSHELHDGVAQTATALARMLEGTCTEGAGLDATERARLAGIARDLVKELRGVIRGLRPTLLDDLGLAAGLQSLAETLDQDGYTASLHIEGDVTSWPAPIETALFRVAQEAVMNVRKHAGGPCPVRIELRAPSGEPTARLLVADAGHGLGPAADGVDRLPHFGIDIMRERIAAIGGKLTVRNGRGGGVAVTASFPRPA